MKKLTLPLTKEDVLSLHAGDAVSLSGVVLTARDCAHKRIFEYLDRGEKLPFELKNATIYYAGPCPAKPGMASGSCGPTTSARMESFAPRLFDLGLNSTIGKGEMSDEVSASLVRNKAVYFAAVGGAGALLSKCIKEAEVVAYDDLGTEAIRRLRVEDLPVIVVIDSEGNNLYATAADTWKR